MKISTKGLDLIKKFEGLRLESYMCPSSVATVGYGHTNGVKLGMTITKEQADEFLKEDVESFPPAEKCLLSSGRPAGVDRGTMTDAVPNQLENTAYPTEVKTT